MTTDAKFRLTAEDATKAALASVRGGLGTVTDKVFGLQGAITGLVGAGGMAALVGMSMKSADELAKTSDTLSVAMEKMAGLHHATSLATSAGIEVMNKTLEKAKRNLGEFNATGSGPAAQWLEKLNLDTKELATLSADKLFERYADAISGMNDRGQQFAATTALMGKEATQLMPLIDEGAAGLRAAQEEAQALGLSMSRVDAAKIEMANDNFTRIQGAIKGAGNALAIHLSPFITAATDKFIDLAKESGGVSNFIGQAMEKAAQAVGFLADSFRGLEVVWAALKVGFYGVWTGIFETLAAGDRIITAIKEKLGMDVQPSPELQRWAAQTRLDFELAKGAFNELVNTPMPSGGIIAGFKQIQYEAQKAAEQIAATKAAATGGESATGGAGIGTGGEQFGPDRKMFEERQAFIEQHLAQIDQANQTETERLQAALIAREAIINEAAARRLITEQRQDELLTAEHQRFETQRTAISQKEEQARSQIAYGTAANAAAVLQQLGQKNKTFAYASLAITKGIAIAQTLAHTQTAAMLAFSSQLVPGDPTSPARAAAAYAKTQSLGRLSAALIAAGAFVEGGSMGGGGSASGAVSSGGGVPITSAPPTNTQDQGGQVNDKVTVIVFPTSGGGGQSYEVDEANIDKIMDGIRNRMNNDGRRQFDVDSAQMQDIVAAVKSA